MAACSDGPTPTELLSPDNLVARAPGDANWVTRLRLTPGTSSVEQGEHVRLTVEAWNAAGNRVSDPDVRWRSTNPDVAIVTSHGVVYAQDADGTATINAWIGDNGDAQASHEMTVGAGGSDGGGGSDGTTGRIRLTPSTSTVAPGEHIQLTVEAWNANGDRISNPDLGWRSSNPDVAIVTSDGEVRAQDVRGTATIRVWLRDGSGTYATHEMTVGDGGGSGGGDGSVGPVTRMRLVPGTSSVARGDHIQLTVEAWDADGDRVPNPDLGWRSSNPDVAIVTSHGEVRAQDINGTATIRAWIRTGGDANATHEITVGSGGDGGSGGGTAGPVTRLRLSPGTSSVSPGDRVQLTVEAWDADGTRVSNPDMGWRSSNPDVAIVTSDGEVRAQSEAGTATIHAWIRTGGDATDTHEITVGGGSDPAPDPSPGPGSGPFHEPDGFTTLINESWNAWGDWYHVNKDVGHVGLSNGRLVWSYEAGMEGGVPPGGKVVMDHFPHGPYEYQRDEGVRLSNNFHGHRSGVNKFRYWTTDNRPRTYIAFIGPDDSRLTLGMNIGGWPEGAAALRWNSAENHASPTLEQATVTRGVDHTIETLIYVGTPGRSDGFVRAWLNGVLILDFRNLAIIASGTRAEIEQVHFAPVWGGVGDVLPNNQTLSVAHTYVSHRR
ncbi:MAG TPA: Ig-like domain-containing protein [Longimicrobiales bacterium]|nr:Ig-like domain-containing protein [Longimicrobiales bacterium]